MTFAQPSAGGDAFESAAHNGKLILVYPTSYQSDFETKHGTCPAVSADIVIVDAPGGKPQLLSGSMLFGNLARSVQSNIGGVVLGRLGQGPNTKGNPPWLLKAFTEEDSALARPAHDAYKNGALRSSGSSEVPEPPFEPTAGNWSTPPPKPSVDPQLVAFLASKGVTVGPDMTEDTARMIAATFPKA